MENRTKLEIAGVAVGLFGILFDVNGMLFPDKPIIVEKEVPIYINKPVVQEITHTKVIEKPIEVEVIKEVEVVKEKIIYQPKPVHNVGLKNKDFETIIGVVPVSDDHTMIRVDKELLENSCDYMLKSYYCKARSNVRTNFVGRDKGKNDIWEHYYKIK